LDETPGLEGRFFSISLKSKDMRANVAKDDRLNAKCDGLRSRCGWFAAQRNHNMDAKISFSRATEYKPETEEEHHAKKS
jgi:hypothetical protein